MEGLSDSLLIMNGKKQNNMKQLKLFVKQNTIPLIVLASILCAGISILVTVNYIINI